MKAHVRPSFKYKPLKKGKADYGNVYNKILKHLTSECLYLRDTMISKLIFSLYLS